MIYHPPVGLCWLLKRPNTFKTVNMTIAGDCDGSWPGSWRATRTNGLMGLLQFAFVDIIGMFDSDTSILSIKLGSPF